MDLKVCSIKKVGETGHYDLTQSLLIMLLQRWFDFSDGTSAKWIFDVEIEKFWAGLFKYVEKTKLLLEDQGKLLIGRLRPIFYNFIFTFPELTLQDFLLVPHQNIYISAKEFIKNQ